VPRRASVPERRRAYAGLRTFDAAGRTAYARPRSAVSRPGRTGTADADEAAIRQVLHASYRARPSRRACGLCGSTRPARSAAHAHTETPMGTRRDPANRKNIPAVGTTRSGKVEISPCALELQEELVTMAEWQFYVDADRPGIARLMRRRVDEPLLCAEALHPRDGLWWRADDLYRQIMLGSDYDYKEVTETRAAAVVQEWITAGFDVSLTGPSHDRPEAETTARFAALEAVARERWAAVPIPPGAETIKGFPPKTRDNDDS
jgi:hypothetical protein